MLGIPKDYMDYVDKLMQKDEAIDNRITYLFHCKCLTKMNKIEHEFYVVSKSFPECEEKLKNHLTQLGYDWDITSVSPIDDVYNGLLL